MKKSLLVGLLSVIIGTAQAQIPSGKVIYDRLYSSSLENRGGEDPSRRVSIYLPPDYDQTTDRYPVIYYLHGFTQNDSLLIARQKLNQLLDKAIATRKIQPVIFAMADQYTSYRGSFYTNSSLTGNWADFTSKDLVEHIEENYRTIPDRESRGMAGHSMGGHGAIKLGMLFPEVFGSIYALSCGVLDLEGDFGMESEAFKSFEI